MACSGNRTITKGYKKSEPSEHPSMFMVAGPGTLLARWISFVCVVLTLGIVSVRCVQCNVRKQKLDNIGWAGLLNPARWIVYMKKRGAISR